jgi:hypothetical protein
VYSFTTPIHKQHFGYGIIPYKKYCANILIHTTAKHSFTAWFYGETGAIARILPDYLSRTTVMSSLRVDGVKSGGRKPTLDSSRPLVVRNAFSFSVRAAIIFGYSRSGGHKRAV